MTLDDLTGQKLMIETTPLMCQSCASGESFETLKIGLSGKTYVFVEDPADGYRSYLVDDIKVIDEPFNEFRLAAPIAVTVRRDNSPFWDVIELVDDDGHVWLRIGTDGTDDYYPYCVLTWAPKEDTPTG